MTSASFIIHQLKKKLGRPPRILTLFIKKIYNRHFFPLTHHIKFKTNLKNQNVLAHLFIGSYVLVTRKNQLKICYTSFQYCHKSIIIPVDSCLYVLYSNVFSQEDNRLHCFARINLQAKNVRIDNENKL